MLRDEGSHAANSVKVTGGSPTGLTKDLVVSNCCEGKDSVPMSESGPGPAPGSEVRGK